MFGIEIWKQRKGNASISLVCLPMRKGIVRKKVILFPYFLFPPTRREKGESKNWSLAGKRKWTRRVASEEKKKDAHQTLSRLARVPSQTIFSNATPVPFRWRCSSHLVLPHSLFIYAEQVYSLLISLDPMFSVSILFIWLYSLFSLYRFLFIWFGPLFWFGLVCFLRDCWISSHLIYVLNFCVW